MGLRLRCEKYGAKMILRYFQRCGAPKMAFLLRRSTEIMLSAGLPFAYLHFFRVCVARLGWKRKGRKVEKGKKGREGKKRQEKQERQKRKGR